MICFGNHLSAHSPLEAVLPAWYVVVSSPAMSRQDRSIIILANT